VPDPQPPEPQLLFGASPISHAGSRQGVLLSHGFTGNPSTMRPVADAFVRAGWSVELPRLPGHGTTLEDMNTTGWDDWLGEVRGAYARLRANADTIVVGGLSMGGTLVLALALEQPDIAGVIAINPKVLPEPPEVVRMVRDMVAEGDDHIPGIGSDIAKPGVKESAYDGTPLRPLLDFLRGIDTLQGRFAGATMPLLLMTSIEDHVVPPENSDALASQWGGPVERVTLERSYHVATLDHDAELIRQRAVEFAGKVAS
jgi:carboxylesterase